MKKANILIIVNILVVFLTTSMPLFSYETNNNNNDLDLSRKYTVPPVPYPEENPPNEAKILLGKILFWDEQLSTDNSIACGSCHLPSFAGSDNRLGHAPGFDKKRNTKDDIIGSRGVINRDALGRIQAHPIYDFSPQITGRTSQPFFSSLWAKELFWDGRAASEFISPESETVVIREGGALENQALGPLNSAIEMAKNGQLPHEITHKLVHAKPLALASNLPKDIKSHLVKYVSYPALFQAAFESPKITQTHIAFAIASYERSLVADQTPWDNMVQKGDLLPYLENLGWQFFKQSGCEQCHQPPLFTDNKFYNIGIQGRNADKGRLLITQEQNKLGAMKVPSLRNSALKTTYMHNGHFNTLDGVLDAYADVPFKDIADTLPDGEKYDFQFTELQRRALLAFITTSLTDPRVKLEQFPFDRPTLRTEQLPSNDNVKIEQLTASVNKENNVLLKWVVNNDLHPVYDIEIVRNDGRHFWVTKSPFIDQFSEFNTDYNYELNVRNPTFNTIQKLSVTVSTSSNYGALFSKGSIVVLLILIVLVWIATKNKKRVTQ